MTDTPIEVLGEDRLQLHVEAIEHLEGEKKDLAGEIRDRYALAKGEGYDVKILRKVIKRRAVERADLEEEDAVLATYEAALSA